MARQLFGTDGIRGEANRHPMTADIAYKTGRALAFMVGTGRLGRAPVVV
ncbi:MAG TPA: phosphoglucosamine mutase, partial [Myxococcota bacterium]